MLCISTAMDESHVDAAVEAFGKAARVLVAELE
jgi:hypothetical protein